ncbi:MAG: DUF2225 domain-containing protein [Lachnospiraceae bacterium]|nr:DUF2225 domain-containing protein [Lachnospiraceae bacterium]
MAMNLLAGLEKFGFGGKEAFDITDDGSKKKKESDKSAQNAAKPMEEKDFLLEKKVTCAICDKPFTALVVKGSKARRLENDPDLRPNYEGVDVVKYDVLACPHCGYAAMLKSFEHVSPSQLKWVREGVCANFRAEPRQVKKETYTYDEAIDRYKLALVSAMAKKVKLSEKSYICLKIAWLIRAQIPTIKEDTADGAIKKRQLEEEYKAYYKQAYEGFMKVSSTETPPFYGMNENTLEYMLANMAFYFVDYQTSLKLISRLITSTNTPSKIKELCLDLKEDIQKEMKKEQLLLAKQQKQAQQAQAAQQKAGQVKAAKKPE